MPICRTESHKNEKDNFYENKVGNGYCGPRYGRRCGDAGPYRLGRVFLRTEDVFGLFRYETAVDRRLPLKVYPTEAAVRELLRPHAIALAEVHEEHYERQDDDPIVGFWRVKLVSKDNSGIPDGAVLDAGYSQWHSDGTEILNSSRPPETQSFCLGVWKKVGPFHYKLNHFAISWANGNLLGPANIREDIVLSHDGNSFTGTFTIDQYDQAGNTLVHLVGQIEAKRITVDTPVTDVL